MSRPIAPGAVHRGWGVMDSVGSAIVSLGSRPMVVHGSVGHALVSTRLNTSLSASGIISNYLQHDGPVTTMSLEMHARAVHDDAHDLVVGVGGGKVLDVAKGVADRAEVPCVTIPTSPATCAAVTALTVLYGEDGSWSGPSMASTCPALVVLDTEILATAPDRLLAAGVLDALAKVEEVRLAAGVTRYTEVPEDPWLDTALAICNTLATWVDPRTGALVDGLPSNLHARASLAEAIVVLPGLIAALAGEGNKLAAAHAVHNAMTRVRHYRKGVPTALHGECVGFGLLVQAILDGADDASLTHRVAWMNGLGVDAALEQLGCSGYWKDSSNVLAWLANAPSLTQAFPGADEGILGEAIERANRIAVANRAS